MATCYGSHGKLVQISQDLLPPSATLLVCHISANGITITQLIRPETCEPSLTLLTLTTGPPASPAGSAAEANLLEAHEASTACCAVLCGSVAGCRVGAVTPAARMLRTLSLVSVLGLSLGKAHVLPAPAHTCSVPGDGVPAWHREQVHCLNFQDKRFCSIPLRGCYDLGCECTQHMRHPPLTHRQPGRGAGQRQLRERDPKAGGSQRKVLGLTAPAPRGNSVVIESRPLPRPVNRTLRVKPSNLSKFYFS